MTPDEEICSRGRMECTMSLAKAVQEAGGAVSAHLLDMTVAEFIREVAGQNNIQFVFVGPKKVTRDRGGVYPRSSGAKYPIHFRRAGD